METFTLTLGRCWLIRAVGRNPLVRSTVVTEKPSATMVEDGIGTSEKAHMGDTIGASIQPMGTEWAAAVKVQHAVRDAVLRLSGSRMSNDGPVQWMKGIV